MYITIALNEKLERFRFPMSYVRIADWISHMHKTKQYDTFETVIAD